MKGGDKKMFIIEQYELSKAKYIEIVYEGSGNPDMIHEIKGIKFRDAKGYYYFGIGEIPCMPTKHEFKGKI